MSRYMERPVRCSGCGEHFEAEFAAERFCSDICHERFLGYKRPPQLSARAAIAEAEAWSKAHPEMSPRWY